MTTAILVIGDVEIENIAKAIAEAKKHPLSLSVVKDLAAGCPQDATKIEQKDIKESADRRQRDYPPQRVMLGNMRCAFSYEEQPTGMVKHLSISSPNSKDGLLPTPEAVKMACEAFGFDGFPPKDGKLWLEEFDAGEYAVNVIEVDHEFSSSEG